MTEATVHRIHAPSYTTSEYPPMPPRIRLARNCWERVWWLTLAEPLYDRSILDKLVKYYTDGKVVMRAQMRTHRRICFAITATDLDEQGEFELSMMIMSRIQRDIAQIERVEDRLASCWPIDEF